jgi:small subunit ribosomal protein S6
MPLYELLCLAKPLLPKDDMFRMMHKVGTVVFDKGGIITTLKSYGNQTLAQDIRKTPQKFSQVGVFSLHTVWLGTEGPTRVSQAHMWQMDFMLSPDALKEVNHELRVNESVLRWIVLKRKSLPDMPNQRNLFWNHPEHGPALRPESKKQWYGRRADV